MVTEAPISRRQHALANERKLELVERILRGQLSLQEACSKHGLTGAELKEWIRLYRREARRVLDERVRAALSTEGMELEDIESAEFSGNVETLAVAEVIQTLALGRKDAEITIEHGGQQSRIWCAEGDVVDAECGRLIGAPAVYRLLTVERGRVFADCSARFAELRRPRTITVSTQALLMEAARRADESRQLRERLGDMNLVYVLSGAAMAPDARASATEFAVLRLLGGQRSLERVVQDSSLPDLETLTHLVELRERGLMDPRVTPLPPVAPAPRSSRRPITTPEEPCELSFVPLAASLGTRYEPRSSRRWVWGFVAIGASTLGLALFLRYSERARTGLWRAARTESAAAAPVAAILPPAALAAPPAAAVLAPAALPAAPVACPEGAALLSRPATRDAPARSYCLDRYEVTAGAYAQCVSAGQCAAPRRESALPEVALSPGARRRTAAAFAAQCNSGAAGRGQHPMNCVSYEEAEAYCAWRGGALPSEDDWDFAAAGARGRPYPWGNDAPGPGLVNACGSECRSWYNVQALQGVFEGLMYDGGDGYAGTAPVGSFPAGATPEGVLDLIGNVAEWTAGRVEVYDGEPGADAIASHVVRGGAFTSSQAALAPPVLRLYLSGGERDRSVGFRCAYLR
ncbi:MAG TPA: SUMF1/EgtB/PvdO family nonheme iron enzyme [Polyangiaceae bacterium]|nr:SUMF1/EgtB/PvdO family nonheme iron enzyme [Polyangiaceae bacterium]